LEPDRKNHRPSNFLFNTRLEKKEPTHESQATQKPGGGCACREGKKGKGPLRAAKPKKLRIQQRILLKGKKVKRGSTEKRAFGQNSVNQRPEGTFNKPEEGDSEES